MLLYLHVVAFSVHLVLQVMFIFLKFVLKHSMGVLKKFEKHSNLKDIMHKSHVSVLIRIQHVLQLYQKIIHGNYGIQMLIIDTNKIQNAYLLAYYYIILKI